MRHPITNKLSVSARALCLNILLGATALTAQADDFTIRHLSSEQNIINVQNARKYLLLPIQDNAPESKISIVKQNYQVGESFNVRLAREKVDYYVPIDLTAYIGSDVAIDIEGMPANAICWKKLKLSDTFDTSNRETFRPLYHHTPSYGWMNDPNGMFYKDGTWHLYYQYNPYGSSWGNMTWGHSTSRDLVNWTHHPAAITAALPTAQPTAQPAADNSDTAPQTSFPFPEEIPWENDYNYAPSTDNAAPYTQQQSNMAQLPATATEAYGAEVQNGYSNGGGLSVYNPENNAPIRYERAAAQPTAYRERRPTFSSIFTGKDEFEYIARGYSDPALHGAKDATIAGVLPASTALNYTDPQISRARAEESKQNAAYSGRLPQQTAPNFNASHTSPQSPQVSAHKDEHAGDRISMAFGRMPLPQWVTTTKMPSPSSTEATTDTEPSQRPPQNSAAQAQTAQSPEPAEETANDAQQQHAEQEYQNNH